MADKEEKLRKSLNQFRALFEDSGHEYLTTSDEEEIETDTNDSEEAEAEAETDPNDPVSQFTVNTEDHEQEYISLDSDQEWERVAPSRNPSRKRKDTNDSTSDDSEPVPSTSTGIRDKDEALAFMRRGNQIDVKVTKELHRQEKKFMYYDELYSIKFTQKTEQSPTILSLFLAFTQALNTVLNKLRILYKDRLASEDHIINICVTEDRIQVSSYIGDISSYALQHVFLIFRMESTPREIRLGGQMMRSLRHCLTTYTII